MSVRTITYCFDGSSVSPDTAQYGGVRFEDNATTVEFILDEDFKAKIEQEFKGSKICYRIDFNGDVSGYNPSENLNINENRVQRSIPLCMTASGEQITAVLVVTAMDDEETAIGTISSVPLKIYFDNVLRDETDGVEVAENLSAIQSKTNELCILAKNFCDSASDSAAEAAAAADCAQDALEQTENARFALENGAELVLLGGDAKGSVDVELVIDEEVSLVSENLVKNCAVAEAIESAKEELKEYTDTEIATFDFIKVVDSLETTGLPNRIYLVPKSDTQSNDLFDEYIWANDKWEFITTKQLDLTPYIKKEELGDYVVEQGESGIWTYRKWNSGIFECWGNSSMNVSSFAGAGSIWFANWTVSLPFVSTTAPVGSGSSRWYFGNWVNVAPVMESNGSVDGSKVTVMLYQTQAETGNRSVFLYVKGTWK